MIDTIWISDNYIEVFGAIAGLVYVFLEIRQTIWLWPVGIVTSAVYIWVFFTNKLYADMSLQGYYLGISFLGWYWWVRGTGKKKEEETRDEVTQFRSAKRNERIGDKGRSDAVPRSIKGEEEREKGSLVVTRLKARVGIFLAVVFVFLFVLLWLILDRLTDSPVPGWDSFITSLSIIATWMLARKIYEHWYLWIIVNSVASGLFLTRGLYPTVILYAVYGIMSFVGLVAWKKTIRKGLPLTDL